MTLYDLLDIVWFSFASIIIVPIILGILYWKILSNREQKLVWFLIIMLILEIVATILRYSIIRNHFLFYFRTVVVLWIGTLFFERLIERKNAINTVAFVIFLGMIVEVFGFVGFNYMNVITRTVSWLLLAIYAFISLLSLLNQSADISLRNDPMLYYYFGFVFIGFFSGGTSLFENYFIETSLDLYYFFDTLLIGVSAMVYVLFAIGLSKRKQFPIHKM